MSQPPDLRDFLDSWPYDPDENVRLARCATGSEIMLVRQPMGLEVHAVDGRPDRQRPHEMSSAFDFQIQRLAATRLADGEYAFQLTAADCVELIEEGILYYHRFLYFFQIKDWTRAERDTARNLRLLDFVKRYAENAEDRVQLEQWRSNITRMNAIARAMRLLEKGQFDEALKTSRENFPGRESIDGPGTSPQELSFALLRIMREFLAVRQMFGPREESMFRLEGDYWTITYQGQTAHLKATRGLYCLFCLLRRPGRECHVSELFGRLIETPAAVKTVGQPTRVGNRWQSCDSCPILDVQAKAQYKRRINELRTELEEAERFNNPERVTSIREEINSISGQVASAVGLGGRDRKTGSQAERARSAITKRIREAIAKVAEVNPSLGHHLAERVKTGYFCSYNPHPDHPVVWKF